MGPMGALVLLVAVIGGAVVFFKQGWPQLQKWVDKIVWKSLPPDWPRPVPPGGAPPRSAAPGGGPAAAEPPATSDCPNGTGNCLSDDKPIVAPVPLPPACRNLSVNSFKAAKTKQLWLSALPVIGPLVGGFEQAFGAETPMQKVAEAMQQSSRSLQEASAQWQNAYVRFLGYMGPAILNATKDVLGAHGYIDVIAQYATLPLNQAVQLLVAPVVGLLVCSAILVWAI